MHRNKSIASCLDLPDGPEGHQISRIAVGIILPIRIAGRVLRFVISHIALRAIVTAPKICCTCTEVRHHLPSHVQIQENKALFSASRHGTTCRGQCLLESIHAVMANVHDTSWYVSSSCVIRTHFVLCRLLPSSKLPLRRASAEAAVSRTARF